jgi:hypothetical protein
MPITIDKSAAPLIVIRFDGPVDDTAFDRYLAAHLAILANERRYGIAYDAMAAAVPTARQRTVQAQWMREHALALRHYCVAAAFAIGSPLVRGSLTAILWIFPAPFPHTVVGSVVEAEQWVRARLRSSRVEPWVFLR